MENEKSEGVNPNEKNIKTIKLEKEIEKIEEEIAKTKNENRELTKKWFWKPVYIAAFSPFIIGALTILIAWKSGFLQAQAKLNEVQKLLFEEDKKSNKTYLDSLKRQGEFYADLSKSLKKETDSIRVIKDFIQKKIESLQKDNNAESKKVNDLVNQLAVLEYQKTILLDSIEVLKDNSLELSMRKGMDNHGRMATSIITSAYKKCMETQESLKSEIQNLKEQLKEKQ